MNRDENKKLRLIIAVIFLSMFVTGTVLMFITPLSVKSTYGLTAETKDGQKIAFNVHEPVNGEKKMKAFLIGHGWSCSKEYLKGYGIELAAAGFVAVPFDFRGHGQSSGELTRENLIKDVKAIKAYLRNRGDIDMNDLGYIGYSMGGRPGNEIVKEDKDFKCLIGIGTALPYTDDDDDLVVEATESRGMTCLMILARYDEAFELKNLKKGMAKRLDVKPSEVEVNKLYGNFEDRTASKIFRDDNSDHLTTAWDQDFIREARDWALNTFRDVDPVDQNFYVNIRVLILIMQLIGGLGLFFLLIEPLSKKILKQDTVEFITLDFPDESIKGLSLKTFAYSFIPGVLGCVLYLMLLIFMPLYMTAAMLSLVFGHAFGILFLIWRLSKKNNMSIKELLLKPFKSRGRNQHILLGFLMASILYIILMVSIGNYVGMVGAFSIYRIFWVIGYFAAGFFLFFVIGLFNQGMLQNKFKDEKTMTFKTILLSLTLVFAYFAVLIGIVCIVSHSFFFLITLIIAGPLILLSSVLGAVIYKKTGNIIAGSITSAFVITFLISSFSPLASTLEFIGGFF